MALLGAGAMLESGCILRLASGAMHCRLDWQCVDVLQTSVIGSDRRPLLRTPGKMAAPSASVTTSFFPALNHNPGRWSTCAELQ